MNIVTEDFVSFETARLLKEKGFNEKVVCYYDDGGSLNLNKFVEFQCCNQGYGSSIFAAPTLQMACKWLREVHNLWCEISPEGKGLWYREVYSLTDEEYIPNSNGHKIKSYEKACEAAIKYCLENLI